MTFGSRGTYLNAGIPGSGLYAREWIGETYQGRAQSDDGTVRMSVTISVEDDGTVVFRDKDGTPLDERLIKQVKEQYKDKIYGLMETACSEINGHIEALEQIHFATPNPNEQLTYTPRSYDVFAPAKPESRKHGILGTLFDSTRTRIDQENASALAAYQTELRAWERQKQQHDARELAHKALVEVRVLTEIPAMEIILEESLKDIAWPRETVLSNEIRDDGRVVMVDIDLPEIDELPRKTASVPTRGYRLSIKELSATRHQQLYMRHIHGIGFRIIGEIFSVLPKSEKVVLSGYSQRPDKATGIVQDQYLYSVRVNRRDWAVINFSNLPELDAVEALSRFDIRHEITKSGVFKEIIPFDEPSGI
jgi:hypothetical protein